MFNNLDSFNRKIPDRNYKKNVVAAFVKGGPLAPGLSGVVTFEDEMDGTKVTATFFGLPEYFPGKDGQAPIGPFGFHIHENGNCNSDMTKPNSPFENAAGHWNPTNQPHGNHAGDFPVVFSNNGYSHMMFFTNRFKPNDVLGKSVILHQNPDDYRTQPSGDSGKRLACGTIEYVSINML